MKRVVVTGLGTINPLGNDIASYFKNLDEGVSGAGLIDRFDVSLFKTKFACQIEGYNPEEFGFDRKEARKNDHYAQFAIIAADQAVKDAKINIEEEDPYRVGVVVGSGIGGVETITSEMLEYTPGAIPRFSPIFIPKLITNIAPGVIAIRHGFRGPNHSVSSACATATHAIGVAMSYIQTGKADIIVAGGSEAPITIPGVGGFNSAQALSARNDEYKTASRPFDATRDGFVMGEGAGVVVLEEYEHAKKRGATIYAELAGFGFTDDAHHITAPDPEGKGAAKAMELALKDAGVTPAEVDYINAHGTSTHLGDIAELGAIKQVFGDAAYKTVISSTKSMTGHLLGAAGAVETLACIHAMRDGIIPPTINFKEEDPEIDYKLNLSLSGPQHRTVRVALNNNFGFGGQNACLVLKAI